MNEERKRKLDELAVMKAENIVLEEWVRILKADNERKRQELRAKGFDI